MNTHSIKNMLKLFQKRAFKKFPYLPIFAFVFTILYFIVNENIQSKQFHPNKVINSILEAKAGLVLNTWEVEFFSCLNPGVIKNCEFLEIPKKANGVVEVKLPASAQLQSLVSTLKTTPTHARILHKLSKQELNWLQENPNIGLVFNRSVFTTATFLNSTLGGLGSTLTFFSPSERIVKDGEVIVEFDFDGLPYFGPLDNPPLLVAQQQIALAQSLSTRLESLGGFDRQLVLTIALIATLLAIVMDASVIFQFLGIASFAYATRSFFWTLVDSGSLSYGATVKFTGSLLAAFYTLSLIFFVFVFVTQKSIEFSKKMFFAIFSWFIFVVVSFYASDSSFAIDELVEFVTAFISLGVIFYFAFIKNKFNIGEVKGKEEFGKVSQKTRFLKLILLAVVISLYGYANLKDFVNVNFDGLKSPGGFGHTLLHPSLLCLAFLQVGLLSKQIESAAKALLVKAQQDKELEEGRAYQLAMLPSMRRQTNFFSWRAFYKPASKLAGDWFDLRELEFLDGSKFLIAIVCDVAGHGTASALTTTVLSSHWSIWCEELRFLEAPNLPEQRSNLLQQIMNRLEKGISSGQFLGACTAVSVLIDPATMQGSICSCGHPASVKFSSGSIGFISTPPNNPLGQPDSREGFLVGEFNIEENETIALYSDGLFPPQDTSMGGHIKKLRALFKASPQEINIAAYFLRTLRRTRKFYSVDKSSEDDITLVFFKVNARENP